MTMTTTVLLQLGRRVLVLSLEDIQNRIFRHTDFVSATHGYLQWFRVG